MDSVRHLVLTCIAAFLPALSIVAQPYDDYIGAGHHEGITVTTSSDFQEFGWDRIASGHKTINGDGLDGPRMEAARFLAQATFGANREMIDAVAEMDFEDWIDQQAEVPTTSMLEAVDQAYDHSLEVFLNNGGDPENFPRTDWRHFQYGWWQVNMTNEDLLRQRVALALSEIMVVSANSQLQAYGRGLASYYDVLVNNALGNFEDLLLDVTLHPAMGVYLSHYNNPKAIPELNTHPDENYAREVMQLFSIGLYELNQDGTRELDIDGNPIPTYSNQDITEFAKVFTGLGPGAVVDNPWVDEPEFGLGIFFTDFTEPMAMYEEWHEPGAKFLLNGYTIPSGQSGMQDVEDAVHHLFMHDNVGPFLARRLIQQMVKSNPTPAYVQRVANAFNNNGDGVRGDMTAVVKAVLLDEEARDCEWIQDAEQGKLREPMLRYFHFSRAIEKDSPSQVFYNVGNLFYDNTGNLPMNSPSVFNFYLPDFQPGGEIADQDLFGPEFQIHNSRTSLGFINEVNRWAGGWALLYNWEDGIEPVFIDITELRPLAKDPETLINRLDVLFTNGQLTDDTRENIRNTIGQMNGSQFGTYYLDYRVQLALYLVMISPDYAILK